jgi:hypothetical protein
MRPYVRCALVVMSMLTAGVTTIVPAQAATGPWVEDLPAPFGDVGASVHAHIPGHAGNWHSFEVDIDGDDDGVVGGILDWRCAPSATEITDACVTLAEWDFFGDSRVVVTWSPLLRYMRVVGPITLENSDTGEQIASTVNVRLHATGELTRTVSIQAQTPAYDIKIVDASRDTVTFSGGLGWLKVKNSPSNHNGPLRVVRNFHRGVFV